MASDGPAALQEARRGRHALMVLDVMLPGLDGFEVLKRLRAEGFALPVLLLTARGEEMDRVRGLKLGADDYVTKPFSLLELIARIDALLRRISPREDRSPEDAWESFGSVRLNRGTRTVLVEGRPVTLSPKEFDLLLALYDRRGAVVTRADLMERVFGYPSTVLSRTVDTHVAELRREARARAGLAAPHPHRAEGRLPAAPLRRRASQRSHVMRPAQAASPRRTTTKYVPAATTRPESSRPFHVAAEPAPSGASVRITRPRRSSTRTTGTSPPGRVQRTRASCRAGFGSMRSAPRRGGGDHRRRRVSVAPSTSVSTWSAATFRIVSASPEGHATFRSPPSSRRRGRSRRAGRSRAVVAGLRLALARLPHGLPADRRERFDPGPDRRAVRHRADEPDLEPVIRAAVVRVEEVVLTQAIRGERVEVAVRVPPAQATPNVAPPSLTIAPEVIWTNSAPSLR